MEAIRDVNDESATGELLSAAVSDRCTNCQAPLASDQRYCVNCGERRGTPRFSFSRLAAKAAPPPPAADPPPRPARFSQGTTLVTGVATLILAMGVGVLIGHSGNATRASSPGVQVVSVGGGAAAASPQVAAARKTGKVTGVKVAKVKLTPKVKAAAVKAAGRVLGSSANLAPPTVQPGQSCSHGAGCQGGRFTGNFFGGGQ